MLLCAEYEYLCPCASDLLLINVVVDNRGSCRLEYLTLPESTMLVNQYKMYRIIGISTWLDESRDDFKRL
jgi:hypothetical protein